MDESPRPTNWLMITGIAAAAAVAGFGVAYVFGPAATPPPAPVAATAPAEAGRVEVKIPAAYLVSANITVEAVGSGGVSAEITAPATIASTPNGEATVVARASGTITRLTRRLGDPVRAGEVLATVDSLDAASMAADRRVAAAKADLARKTYARESGLYRQGVTPRQEMEAAQSALAVADAETQRADAIARAARVSGNSVVVVAPISGRITAESAVLGAFVQPQGELFRIADGGAVQVEASVPAADARRILPGDSATIITGQGAPVDATVRSITPTVGGTTQAATVVLMPSSGASQLVAGAGVQVRIRVRSDGGAGGLTVPEDAVQNIDGRDVLFVRTASGFVARPVLVGTRSGGIAQIVSGVRAGERVATRNAFLIKADMIKTAGEEEE